MGKQLKIVELFSGIGSQAKALKNIKANYEIVGTCEWDIHAMIAYDFIHNSTEIHEEAKKLSKSQLKEKLSAYSLSSDGKEKMPACTFRALPEEVMRRVYSAILKNKNFVSIKDLHGKDLPKDIDIMTYSFPCQDLSNVGALHGYTKGIDRDAQNRSCLLWEVERILLERKEMGMNLPQFLLLENVSSLLSPRHRSNFEEWQQILTELGYYNKIIKINASDFGLPQNRYRLLMISILTEKNAALDEYFATHNLEDSSYRATLHINEASLKNFLRLDIKNPKLFDEAVQCQPNDTKSRRKIWEDNLQITDEKGVVKAQRSATLTTKQDRHPNSGNIYFDYDGNTRSKFRYLTPRECFLLMGFDEKDYEMLINNNFNLRANATMFPRDKIIAMAGNSIAVKVLEHIFLQIKDISENILQH